MNRGWQFVLVFFVSNAVWVTGLWALSNLVHTR